MLIPRNIVEVSSWETDEGNVQAAAHFEFFFFFGWVSNGTGQFIRSNDGQFVRSYIWFNHTGNPPVKTCSALEGTNFFRFKPVKCRNTFYRERRPKCLWPIRSSTASRISSILMTAAKPNHPPNTLVANSKNYIINTVGPFVKPFLYAYIGPSQPNTIPSFVCKQGMDSRWKGAMKLDHRPVFLSAFCAVAKLNC